MDIPVGGCFGFIFPTLNAWYINGHVSIKVTQRVSGFERMFSSSPKKIQEAIEISQHVWLENEPFLKMYVHS